MNAIMLRLECLTNLHVGNGDVNYNIIDNEVERDPVTLYPVIHASGVKGALREYFKRNKIPGLDALFGKEAGKDGDKGTSPGKLKILSAEMLAIPVRASAGDKPYYLVSTETAVKRYYRMRREFLGMDTDFTPEKVSGVKVDGQTPESKVTVDGQPLYLLSDRGIVWTMAESARICGTRKSCRMKAYSSFRYWLTSPTWTISNSSATL